MVCVANLSCTDSKRLLYEMKDSKLHIVGLDSLDEQWQSIPGDPNDPNSINKACFFMYCYKVLMCPKRYSHDWGACPYAHNNESARRRDPRKFEYSSCICPSTGKGDCPNGDKCHYAHTLFEYWLHPTRFRTQMCKAGTKCKRALCFFAHTPAELRQPGTSETMVQQLSQELAATALSDGSLLPSNISCHPCASNALTAVKHGIRFAFPGTSSLQQSAVDGSSSSSSFTSATYLQGSTTLALQDLPQQLPPTILPISSNSSLQAIAPGVAALQAQVPSPVLLATQHAVIAPAIATSGLMTSTPPQQQQQLIASMSHLSLGQASNQVYPMQQAPVTVLLDSRHVHLAPPATTVGALPSASTAMPGPLHINNMVQPAVVCADPNSAAMAAPAFAGLAPAGSSMLQQVVLAGQMPLQQMYQQPGVYQVSTPALQYTWMQ